jgi:hypothetical protein
VLGEVGRATAIGASFDDALVAAGGRRANIRRLTETLRTSLVSARPHLRRSRLAQEVRADVRRRAKLGAHGSRAPALPLVFCVLPARA